MRTLLILPILLLSSCADSEQLHALEQENRDLRNRNEQLRQEVRALESEVSTLSWLNRIHDNIVVRADGYQELLDAADDPSARFALVRLSEDDPPE